MLEKLRATRISQWVWLACGLVLGLVLAGGGVTAQETQQAEPVTQDIQDTQDTKVTQSTQSTMTIYLREKGGKNVAKLVNTTCSTYAAVGWVFAHMEPHMENGDQKGVWLTLVKTAQP